MSPRSVASLAIFVTSVVVLVAVFVLAHNQQQAQSAQRLPGMHNSTRGRIGTRGGDGRGGFTSTYGKRDAAEAGPRGRTGSGDRAAGPPAKVPPRPARGVLHLLPGSPLIPAAAHHPPFVAGPLDGLPTPWAVAHRRPLAVMVENYAPDSRPQTGLNAASLVYETVAEGGITRFMAVYLEHDAPLVGPVRSTRVYYNAWANGLHAVLVHAGGNDDAQAQLWQLHAVANLDEVAFEDATYTAHVPFFLRSTDRLIPHNLYTYPDRVRHYLAAKKVQLSGSFPDALPHRQPNAPSHRPSGGVLDLSFSSPDYAVEYRYDRASNRYLRWMGGAPHVDAATGHQLAPSNVLVLQAAIAPDPHGGVDNPGAVYVQCTGSNRAYLFRDGQRLVGTWRKAHGGSRLQVVDGRGRPMAFNPGQTWVEVLPDNGSMTWTPGKG